MSKVIIRGAYDFTLPKGQVFSEPSITQPDLAYSIKQLVTDFSVGQLPSMAQLQNWMDDGDEDMVGDNDLRFSDRAEALEEYLAANKIRRSIFERVKRQKEFRDKQNAEELEALRSRYKEEQKQQPSPSAD